MTYSRIMHLVRTDLRLMLRDGFLLGIGLLYLATVAALRVSLPALEGLAAGVMNYRPGDAYPALLAFLVFFEGALPAGVIIGFLLIDERDQRTLDALRVSPLPLRVLIGYRLGAAYLLSVVTMAAAMTILGLPILTPAQGAVLSLVGALHGPLIALTLAATANNTSEGFAVLKSVNLIGLPALIAWFVAPNWHWPMMAFPAYWTARAVWSVGDAAWLLAPAAALLLSGSALALLYQRYRSRVSLS